MGQLTTPLAAFSGVSIKSLTIDGNSQAEIRGSDVWTTWSQTGSTWTSQQTVPVLTYYVPAGTSLRRLIWERDADLPRLNKQITQIK